MYFYTKFSIQTYGWQKVAATFLSLRFSMICSECLIRFLRLKFLTSNYRWLRPGNLSWNQTISEPHTRNLDQFPSAISSDKIPTSDYIFLPRNHDQSLQQYTCTSWRCCFQKWRLKKYSTPRILCGLGRWEREAAARKNGRKKSNLSKLL